MRRGYETPPLALRLLGVHGLLCDGCNLSYRGFAVPGTVSEHTSRKSRNYRRREVAEEDEQAAHEVEQQRMGYARRVKRHEEGAQPSEVLSFAWYYVKLRVKVIVGAHHTSRPLSIKYRWRNWQHWERQKRS
ncbi:MAG: hypothetical protein H7Y30_02800 [Pyrinomonadaceae bacterium]|nr:hypothetical protein [Pyrinomonadaceae bacterium]